MLTLTPAHELVVAERADARPLSLEADVNFLKVLSSPSFKVAYAIRSSFPQPSYSLCQWLAFSCPRSGRS